jgi:hypothetical protein
MKKITKPDWVGLRSLYLLLASDTSAAQSPEVVRIIEYYRNKYGSDVMYPAMERLTKDNAWRGTFSDPNVAFARRLDSAIKISRRDGEFQEIFYDIKKDMT